MTWNNLILNKYKKDERLDCNELGHDSQGWAMSHDIGGGHSIISTSTAKIMTPSY